MNKEHALLSASKAERWLNCPPSARFEENFPDTSSPFAEEGTAAHKLAEAKLNLIQIKLLLKQKEKLQKETVNELQEQLEEKYKIIQSFTDSEMQRYTDIYGDFVIEKIAKACGKTSETLNIFDFVMVTEQKIDFSNFVPEGFGTVDCLVIANETLLVFDFKYGKGVEVSAIWNHQLLLYGLGGLELYPWADITKVQLYICQPRLDNFSEFQLTVDQLKNFGKEILNIAKIAFEGKGELNAGKWCRFCKAQAACQAHADLAEKFNNSVVNDIHSISVSELGRLLDMTEQLQEYSNALRQMALTRILNGETVQGYKCVQGRSAREYKDEKQALEELKKLGFSETEITETKIISAAKLEKMLGKKRFKEVAEGLITKPEGRPTLAKTDDKRPEYFPNGSAEKDFQDIKI